MADDTGMQHADAASMKHAHEAPIAEFASGTSWEPASSPQFMWMGMNVWRGWDLMAHGNLFLTYDQQGGPRGAGKFESQNWLMLMERHALGSGRITFRQMLSAEPLTTPHPGFPQIFQTGETYHGQALVDHQHPHDVFSEMSVLLETPLTDKVTWLAYAAASGEPALGPTGFPHRISAMELPAAPLSHHVQDSTHVSFGVLTTGFVLGRFKIEGSAFNGREPDEQRWNFDLGALDSFSGRLSVALSRNWTAQYSYGHLRHPEALEETDINRQTASIVHNHPLTNGYWNTALIWGRNDKTFDKTTQNSYLLESVLNFNTKNYAFTRLELVDKDELFPGHAGPSFRIGAYTFGGERDLLHNKKGEIGLGANLMFYSKPATLDPIYGRSPVSFQLFLRLRPPMMQH